MKSEIKWKKESLNEDTNLDKNLYNEDDTNIKYDDNPLKSIVKAAAIIGGGFTAYKAGLLRVGVKQLFKYIEKYNSRTTQALKTIKKWSKKTKDIPIESAIRHKVSMLNFVKNDRYRKNVLDDTLQDTKDLQKSIKQNIQQMIQESKDITKKRYKNTDLLSSIDELNKTLEGVYRENNKGVKQVSQEIVDKILETDVMTIKKAKKSYLRTGYRNLTLNDIGQIKKLDNNKLYFEYKDINKFKFDKVSEDKIIEFANRTTKKGEKVYQTQNFKNLMLDNAILTDKKSIIDLRNASNSFKFHFNSIANDFAIPFLNINPLAMYGLNDTFKRKTRFAPLFSTTIQNAITNTKGSKTMGQVLKSNKPMVYIDGDIYHFNKSNKFTKINKDFKFGVEKIRKNVKSEYDLGRKMNTFRKLYGINIKRYNGVPKKGEKGYGLYKAMKTLDVGFQDNKVKKFSLFNTQSWLAITNKRLDKARKDKVTYTKMSNVFGKAPKGQNVFVAYKKTKTPKQIFKNSKSMKETFKQTGKQILAGSDDIKNTTYTTTVPYFVFERLNESIASFGLGLSPENIGSIGKVFKNLLFKRFLPVYLGYNAIQYVNHLTTDKKGENLQTKLTTGVGYIDVGYHKIKDALHITDIFKHLKKLTPGSDQIGELPGIKALHLTYTAKEQKDYLKHGYSPVRKSRYWQLGNTPFTGTKIKYWQPNLYRRLKGDYKYTDTLYGSRKEYFKHAPFPTPTAPFAPIRHFMTDKYHNEKKHYYDRPYPVTAPAFENVPMIGNLLSTTVGKILKPKKYMHPEMFDSKNIIYANSKNVLMQNNANNINNNDDNVKKVNTNKKAYIVPNKINSKFLQVGSGKGAKDKDSSSNDLATYVTNSGNVELINTGNNTMKYIRRKLKKEPIDKINNANTLKNYLPTKKPLKKIEPIDTKYHLSQQIHTMTDVSGMYGFNIAGYVTGSPMAGKKVMETPSYAYSINRAFWDEEVGGLGGDLSEIYRRFIPKRRKDIEWYNPIRNTMPEWIPGSEYFKDLKHGDPYLKADGKGEIRLPGKAYEKMYNLKNPFNLSIGPSMVGKSKSDIVKHFLKQDTITDPKMIKILKKGTRIHNSIEKQWMDEGLAVEIEGKIDDDKYNVHGRFDAAIHDSTSKTGISIVDIKTISGKKLKSLKKAKDEHVKQLNYYLYATKNKTGYLYYVDRENQKNTKTFKINFSNKLLTNTINTLEAARGEIRQGLRQGDIHRGDLYSVFDRYRILADVAPYSQEFKEVNTLISKMDLKDDQIAEAKQIRARMKEQKKSLRLYPYKFKTANIKKEKVHVIKVLDANTFITKEHPKHPIKLAGVSVSNDKNNKTSLYAQQKIAKKIHAGAKLTIGIDADINNRITNDTMQTVRTVVYKNNTNINKWIINNNLGKEKKKDDSPAGINARFSSSEIRFGKAWETIAHLNTYINTKFLQVRSAKESYERREVYGNKIVNW